MKKYVISTALIIITSFFTGVCLAQEKLPADFDKNLKEKYGKRKYKEMSFERFLEIEKSRSQKSNDIQSRPPALYNGCNEVNTSCGNGDFESGLNTLEWDGGFGQLDAAGAANFATMLEGISGGALNIYSSHQTIVAAGIDPNVGIGLVAPGGSTQALRIGNSVNIANSVDSTGTELISKRITVTSAQTIFRFHYAVVLEDPGHTVDEQQPTFWVRVIDCSNGSEITNVCDLGNSSNRIVSDATSPFLSSFNGGTTTIAYRDWSCAQIDLSAHVGKTVSIQFITEDCSLGGHFGYAYIDNFCGICVNNFTFNSSGECGEGLICFDYILPLVGNAVGTATIKLNIYQNGSVIYSYLSPVLTSGSMYCFSVDPTAIPGININLLGFDFTATCNFSVNGVPYSSFTSGSAPMGHTQGFNNDFEIYCPGKSLCKYICNFDNNDYGRSVITTTDGGIAILGTMHDAFPSTEKDMYFVKYGSVLAPPPLSRAKKIGDVTNTNLKKEEGYSITQASDGYYYLAGTTLDSTKDVYIVKLHPTNYSIVWAKNYGTLDHHETGIKILEANSPATGPGFIVVGHRQSVSGNPQHDIFAFKIDPAGNYNVALGTHIYGGATLGVNDDYAWDAIKPSSLQDEYVIVGETNEGTNQNFLAFRINGNTLAMNPNNYYTIDDIGNESARAVEEINGKLFITGKSNFFPGQQGDDVLLTVLPSGFIFASLNTSRVYGKLSDPSAKEEGYNLVKVNDTTIAIVGYKEESQDTKKDGLVFKVNTTDLSIIWSRRLGSTDNPYVNDDEFFDIAKLPSNQLVITGYTGITSTDNELFVSMISAGDSACCYLDYPMNIREIVHPGPKFFELVKDTFKTGIYGLAIKYYCEKDLCARKHIETERSQGSENIMSIGSLPGDAEGRLVIYPNPNEGSFRIKLPADEPVQTISIRDLSGRVLYVEESKKINATNSLNISVPGLTGGIYIVEVKTISNKYAAKMIIE